MARIIDYEQDEDKPFGVGKFKLDDGSDYYLDDPGRARSFLSDFEKESNALATGDRKLTGKDEYSNAVAKLAGGPGAEQMTEGKRFEPGKPDRYKGALAGPGGDLMSEPESNMTPLVQRGIAPDERGDLVQRGPSDPDYMRRVGGDEPNMSVEPEPPKPSEPMLDERELREQEAARRANTALGAVRRTTTGGVDPRRMQAQGVPVDKKITTEAGLPAGVYEQQAADRATAYDATNTVMARHQAEDEARAAGEVERLRKEVLDSRKANDARTLEVQRVETKYKEDRAWLDKEVDDHYDKAKPDPDKIFKDRGVFGNIASAVAQFMGAYAAIVSGSPNFAAQILDKKIDRSVDAQIEGFKSGKAKLDSKLHRMAERGMSIEEMRSALRLQHERVVQKEIQAASLNEGSRESKQAAEALLMVRQERFVADENEFRVKALGKTTVQADVIQPTAGRRKTPLELLKEQGDILAAQNRVGFEAGGGEAQERADVRTDKRAEFSATRDAKVTDEQVKRRTDYGNRRGTLAPAAEDAQKARDTIQEIYKKRGSLPGVGEFDLGKSPELQGVGNAVGIDYMEDAGRVQQALKTLRNAAVAANAGSQTEGDVGREVETMMGPNQSESQVLAGVERLHQRATAPLIELEGTYSDVKREQERERDKAALDRYNDLKRRRERIQGEAY